MDGFSREIAALNVSSSPIDKLFLKEGLCSSEPISADVPLTTSCDEQE